MFREIEERFLTPQSDRFTLIRASQNEAEKKKRQLAAFEMTAGAFADRRRPRPHCES